MFGIIIHYCTQEVSYALILFPFYASSRMQQNELTGILTK